MTDIVWVHEDALRLDHPVFATLDKPTYAFIFDDVQLMEKRYSLKRLQFITETLIEMNVPMYRGDTIACLKTLLVETGATRVLLAESTDPEIARCAKELQDTCEVIVIRDDPFIPQLEGDFPRFFRFWNKVRRTLLD